MHQIIHRLFQLQIITNSLQILSVNKEWEALYQKTETNFNVIETFSVKVISHPSQLLNTLVLHYTIVYRDDGSSFERQLNFVERAC